MNVAKNWALTIMLIALAFAHFSSELLLKEQMIIPVKKTLNNAGHIDAKLIDFSEICQKKSSEIGCFLLIVSWRSFPPKFPVKSADFPKNLLPKILWKLTFFRKNPAKWADFSANFDFSPAKISRNRPIVPRILTFFPRKCREIGRFFREFAPENPAKFCFLFREISEALPKACWINLFCKRGRFITFVKETRTTRTESYNYQLSAV